MLAIFLQSLKRRYVSEDQGIRRRIGAGCSTWLMRTASATEVSKEAVVAMVIHSSRILLRASLNLLGVVVCQLRRHEVVVIVKKIEEG
jgi:hypothetical protein